MSNDSLESLVEELAKLRAVAQLNLDSVPSSVKPAWTSRISAAKEAVKELESKYRTLVLTKLVPVFVSGPEDKVAQLLKLTGEKTHSVDASALYNSLTDEVEPLFGHTRQWTADQTYRMRLRLQKELANIGVDGIDAPDFGNKTLADRQATFNHIADCLNKTVGTSLNVLSMQKTLVDEALESEHIADAPYLVVNIREQESQSLKKDLSGKVGAYEIQMTEEDVIDDDYVTRVFANITSKKKEPKKQHKKQ